MQQFIGVKLINAKEMTRLEYNQLRGWALLEDENGEDDGYLVEYIDGGKANHTDFAGYISWSPKDVFERAYRPTETGMNFGLALEALKVGKKVARDGWNGKGMFVYLVPADHYPARTGIAKEFFGENAMVPYGAYLALKNSNNTINTWVPSISDTLAEDWQIA